MGPVLPKDSLNCALLPPVFGLQGATLLSRSICQAQCAPQAEIWALVLALLHTVGRVDIASDCQYVVNTWEMLQYRGKDMLYALANRDL